MGQVALPVQIVDWHHDPEADGPGTTAAVVLVIDDEPAMRWLLGITTAAVFRYRTRRIH